MKTFITKLGITIVSAGLFSLCLVATATDKHNPAWEEKPTGPLVDVVTVPVQLKAAPQPSPTATPIPTPNGLTIAKQEKLMVVPDDAAAVQAVHDFIAMGAKGVRLQHSADSERPTQWEVTGVFYQSAVTQ